MTRCEHYVCRCARAEELSQMADRVEARHGVTSLSMRLRSEAVMVHEQWVVCRHADMERYMSTSHNGYFDNEHNQGAAVSRIEYCRWR